MAYRKGTKKVGLGAVSIIPELHLVKNIYFMDISFEKFRDMTMKIKMPFHFTYACSLKEKVGFLTTLTTPRKKQKLANLETKYYSIIPNCNFCSPQRASVLYVALTITKESVLTSKSRCRLSYSLIMDHSFKDVPKDYI